MFDNDKIKNALEKLSKDTRETCREIESQLFIGEIQERDLLLLDAQLKGLRQLLKIYRKELNAK